MKFKTYRTYVSTPMLLEKKVLKVFYDIMAMVKHFQAIKEMAASFN